MGNRTRWIILAATLLLASCSHNSASVAASEADKIMVYVTRTGKKYHRDGCEHLSKSKIPMKLSEAVAEGYAPCLVCDPPTIKAEKG